MDPRGEEVLLSYCAICDVAALSPIYVHRAGLSGSSLYLVVAESDLIANKSFHMDSSENHAWIVLICLLDD